MHSGGPTLPLKKMSRYPHVLYYSVTSVETIKSLCWAAKISSIRKVKEISNLSPEMMICIEKM